jgi:hypothetical protein
LGCLSAAAASTAGSTPTSTPLLQVRSAATIVPAGQYLWGSARRHRGDWVWRGS